MQKNNEVQCPKCGHEIDIKDLIKAGAKDEISKEILLQKKKFEEELEKVKTEKEELTISMQEQEKELTKKLEQEQKAIFAKREEEFKVKFVEEQKESNAILKEELEEKSRQLKDLNKTKAELAKITREKDELKEAIEAEAQENFNQQLAKEKEKINKEILLQKNKFTQDLEKANAEKEELSASMLSQEIELRKKIEQEQKVLLTKKEEEFRTKFLEEQAESNAILKDELEEKSKQLKDLHKTKAELAKITREKDELKEAIEAEAEATFSQLLIEEKTKIKKQESEKTELVIESLKKQLEDQKQLTEEMKRKQEQGSMQLQGEIQELAIEKWLRGKFPIDEVSEVGKGDMGADSLQIVNTKEKSNCGSIYYESKRTKTFSESWIAKFKNDMKEQNADIGVLVTAVFPKDMDRMGLRDGVYICTYEEFKGLCFVLRDLLVKISYAHSAQENREEKSVFLYNYLTSNEFKMQMEGIVNAFVAMQHDLDTEKRAINGHWKKREKQLENVLGNTTALYGSIRGIAGNEIQTVKVLELPMYENNT